MKAPRLHLVSEDVAEELALTPAESISERMSRLQSEMKAAGREQVVALLLAMSVARETALKTAEAEIVPAGIRDIARRYAEETEARAATVTVISERSS